MPNGARVPGTGYCLDPAKAAWDIGTIIRWLDFNDTWLAAEWGHPSDNLSGILALADWLSRNARAEGRPPLTMADVLSALVKAYEIQGVLALGNSFKPLGLLDNLRRCVLVIVFGPGHRTFGQYATVVGSSRHDTDIFLHTQRQQFI